MDRQPLTPEQVAARYGISSQHVRDLLREGELPGIKLGSTWRIWSDALEAWEHQQQQRRESARQRRQVKRELRAVPPSSGAVATEFYRIFGTEGNGQGREAQASGAGSTKKKAAGSRG
jgi:excisionase family DNA binding protein